MSRTRVTAALSLSGVLLAGTAAALVNSQVLSSNSNSVPAAAAVPAVTVATAGSVPATAPPVDATNPAPAASQAEYQVGESGTVVLDASGGGLTLVRATPSPGWLVVAAVQEDPQQVRVELQSFTTVVTFRANVLFGVVSTAVESSSIAGTDDTVGGAPTSGSSPSSGGTPSSGTTATTIDDVRDEESATTTIDDENDDESDDDEVDDD